MSTELNASLYNYTVHDQTLALVLAPDVHDALVHLASNASGIVEGALSRLPGVAAEVRCAALFLFFFLSFVSLCFRFCSVFYFEIFFSVYSCFLFRYPVFSLTCGAHEQAILPLILSVRTNARELVTELIRDFAWPVLGVLVATHLALLLLLACLFKCAHVALAQCCCPRTGAQPAREVAPARDLATRDV